MVHGWMKRYFKRLAGEGVGGKHPPAFQGYGIWVADLILDRFVLE